MFHASPWAPSLASPGDLSGGTMSEVEVPNINDVACEGCRAKKCKCDRVLPTCAQCEKLGIQCSYPQTFKRGFPEGYLAGIEKRLAETERALFETLLSLHGAQCSEPLTPSLDRIIGYKQTKIERKKEWDQLPLTTEQDRWHWMLQKSDRVSLKIQSRSFTVVADNAPTSASPHNIYEPGRIVPNVPASPWIQHDIFASGSQARQHSVEHVAFQQQASSGEARVPYTQDWQAPPQPNVSNTSPEQEVQSPSRAEMLSSRHSKKFF